MFMGDSHREAVEKVASILFPSLTTVFPRFSRPLHCFSDFVPWALLFSAWLAYNRAKVAAPLSIWNRVLLAGFGTDRLRCNQVMKTTGGENQNPWTRAFGAEGQNGSCSNKWAAKQEKLQPLQWCFFLPSPFIELTRTNEGNPYLRPRRP